jgi:hypothetical protein
MQLKFPGAIPPRSSEAPAIRLVERQKKQQGGRVNLTLALQAA